MAKKKDKNLGGAPLGNKNAEGHDGSNAGRPSQYDPKFVDELIAFFDIEPYKREVMESSKEYYASGDLKKVSEKIAHIPEKLPTLFRFARKIGVSYVTVNNWYKQGKEVIEDGPDKGKPKYPDLEAFVEAYEAAKEMQKEFLITIGLAGAAPPSAYIFTAKNITDMRDRIEQDLTSKGDKLGVVYLPQKAPLPNEETK